MPSAMIPPTQPVAISLKPAQTPSAESIPKTIMLRNILGLNFPNTTSRYLEVFLVPFYLQEITTLEELLSHLQ